jgi:hypothetical protein
LNPLSLSCPASATSAIRRSEVGAVVVVSVSVVVPLASSLPPQPAARAVAARTSAAPTIRRLNGGVIDVAPGFS